MKRLLFIFIAFLSVAGIAYAKSLDQVRVQPLPGTVTLSFDDGPSPIYTPKILAILKKYHVNATFFVMGWAVKKYPELIQQMRAEGNAVGSHTNSHKDLTRMSLKNLRYEVLMPKEAIKKVIGISPVCLRPPYGKGNKRIAEFIRQYGMIMVPLGFNSFDYENRGVDKLITWVVSNAKPGRVILLHDGYKHRSQTVKALPAIIEKIRRKGLKFSAICYP